MGGGKSSTSTQSVSIPPEVLARYNAVNARAENVAQQPFQQYGGEFVAPLTPTQTAGIESTSAASQLAQPYYGAATQGLLGAQQGGANYIGAATNQLGSAQQTGQALGAAAGQQYAQASGVATPYYQAATQGTQNAVAGAQPYQQAATMAALAGARGVGPGRLETDRYMNPYVGNVVNATQAALGQQFGQQQSQQQAEAIRAGAFGGERAGLQRAQLMGQQGLAAAQAIAPLYQQGYQQALQTAQQQQGVGLGAEQANRAAIQQAGQQLAGLGQQGYSQQLGAAQQMQGIGQGLYGQALGVGQAVQGLGQQQYGQGAQTAQQFAALGQQGYGMGAGTAQQLAGLGTGAQQAALQGAQAQIGAGTLEQQTQQAQNTAQYQQFLQQRGYDFQVAQFLANIAMGTGALSGSTTTSTQPRGFFSNRGGFKTGDSLRRSGKAYGGGLDPNSMGGAVYEPGAFERGGYATAGSVIDANDLSALLAQQRQSFGPFAAAGPYGQAAGATPHGPGGIVPQQQMHVPKLVTAGAPPKAAPGVGSELGKVYSLADEAAKGLTKKGLTERVGESAFGKSAAPAIEDKSGKILQDAQPATKGFVQEGWDKLFGATPVATGGGIMPRHHYADGGGEDSQGEEAIPYDPSDVSGSKDPMEGVLKAGSQKHELLKPSGGGGGSSGGSSKLGLGKAAGSMIGTAIGGPIGGMFGSMAGSLLPFNEGGVVPRQHFEGGGDAEDSFDRALRTTLGHEGGYTVDTGGPTMKGISSRANPDVDLERVGTDPEYTKGIYRERYWNPIGASEMDPKFAGVAFDAATNHGVGKTKQMLEEAGGDPAKLLQLRQQHYDQLVGSNPEKYGQYARGWNNRLNSFAKELGMEPLAYAGSEGGLGRAAGQQAIQRATSGEGKGIAGGQEPGFFDRNKGIILPVLQGIGAMASSKSISPFAAALQGLGAGAKAYGEEETRQAGLESTKAQTFESAQRGTNLSFLQDGKLVRMPDGSLMLTVEALKKGLIPMGGKIAGLAENSAASKFLASIGINAPAAEQYRQEPEPKAPDFGPKPIDQSIDPNMTDRGIFGNASRQLAQKDAYRTMGLTPAGAAQVSKDYETSTAAAGVAANQNTPIINSLAGNTSKIVNAQGLDAPGKTNEFRANIANGVNTLARSMGYKGEDVLSGDTNAAIQNKLNTFLASQSTEASGQHNLGALRTMLGAMANPDMPPQAQAKIASQIMTMTQKAKDRDAHREVFGDVSGGSFATAGQAFENDTKGRYEREERLLGALILKDPQAVEKLTTGTKSPQVIEQYFRNLSKATGVPYTPGLSRYFVSGVQ